MHINDLKNKPENRDRALNFNFMPADEAALMKKLHDNFNFEPITRKLQEKALLGLVVAAVKNTKEGRRTSYSRRKGYYTGLSEFYGQSFTYSHIIGAQDVVKDSGMLLNNIQSRGTHNTEQSTLTATPKLIAVLKGVELVEKERDLILVKDNDGRPTRIPETEFSVQRRKAIESLNEMYRNSIKVSFDQEFHCYDRWYYINGKFVEVRTTKLYSIFNRGTFDCGGRLYDWHTGLRKDIRPKILLNGQRCVELDYKQQHPSMLFADLGLQINRDVYDIGEFPRGCYKAACQAVLNGSGIHTAPYGMVENDNEFGFSVTEARYMMRKFMNSTQELNEYFFKDCWMKLQRRDSDIMTLVLSRLMSLSIPALSIHDSVIVPVDKMSIAKDILLDTYSEFHPGYHCLVA